MKNRRILGIVVGVLVVAIVAFVAVGLIFENSLPGQLFRGAGVTGGGDQPTYSSAVVDGNTGEWDLINDEFTAMYRASKIGNEVEAYLYLRYDCDTDTMYALVYSEFQVDQLESEAWIALNGISNKVSFSQFAWTPDGRGWEAAFPLAEGSYTLWAHTNVNDGGWQTSGIGDVALTVQCYTPTAVDLKAFVAIQGERGIMVRWETVAEVDNLGFNLYHSTGKEGPWTKLNRDLIPSKVPPGSGEGAVYQFAHAAANLRGENFYLLEDIDVGGAATQHGPITP